MPRAAKAVPVVLLIAAVVALVAACGVDNSSSSASRSADSAGGSTGSGGSTDSGGGSTAGSGERSGLADPAARAGTPAKQAAATTPMSRAVISTGEVSLQATSVSRARAEVVRLVAAWNGSVADEQTNSDAHGHVVDSTMTLRVPTATFFRALETLAGLGKVEQQSSKTEDVTTKVIDNAARVRAAERSIRQVELLLRRAEKLGDIIAIESDLARRQADLDSLKSQQAWLEDQTSLSTITVYIVRAGSGAHRQDEARGFLAGLAAGWDALRGSTLALLTTLGAVLPFAVLVALLGLPLWLVVRRRLGGRFSAGSAPARSA